MGSILQARAGNDPGPTGSAVLSAYPGSRADDARLIGGPHRPGCSLRAIGRRAVDAPVVGRRVRAPATPATSAITLAALRWTWLRVSVAVASVTTMPSGPPAKDDVPVAFGTATEDDGPRDDPLLSERSARPNPRAQPLEVGQALVIETDQLAIEEGLIAKRGGDRLQLGELAGASPPRPRAHRHPPGVEAQLRAYPIPLDLKCPPGSGWDLPGRGQQHRLDELRQTLGHATGRRLAVRPRARPACTVPGQAEAEAPVVPVAWRQLG
jgi:hypothetical protein